MPLCDKNVYTFVLVYCSSSATEGTAYPLDFNQPTNMFYTVWLRKKSLCIRICHQGRKMSLFEKHGP